ncbi:MAG: 5-(carboxyamino)imidazole ribonucleotide synthase [Bacteroidota bacterium]
MEKLVTSNLKLGIIAGGQLGKMLIQAASKWDITCYVLDATENCPAGNIAHHFVQGSHTDYDAVYQFGKLVDVLTFEIESVNVEALLQLKQEGLTIIPDPDILALIQDKGLQKQFYWDQKIPTSPYALFTNEEAIRQAIETEEIAYPFVQKLRKGGYDGRGVSVINSESDLSELLPGPSVIENKVDIEKEIAVIVARNNYGETKCFPIVEMVFDPKANLVDKLVCPANLPEGIIEKANEISTKVAELIEMVGLLAVELFVTKDGEVLVNEVAPRTHNSGHHTIESVVTSQFEQHLRSVLNLPLGSTDLKMPAVMVNLLGEPGQTGPVMYQGLYETLAIDGVNLHLYGKKITKPYRKMGHATVIAPTIEEAIEKAEKVKNSIKVSAWKAEK